MTTVGRWAPASDDTDRPARSPLAVPAAAATFLGIIAFHPAIIRPWFSVKAAVLLVAGAIGIPLLARLAAAGDRAARAAAAMVAWAALSAALARSPLAWAGQFFLGTGAVFVACLGGVWAIGRHLDPSARRLVATAYVAGALVNAVVGILQGPIDLSRHGILVLDGRSTGLMSNPVFLGALCAGAAALLPSRLTRQPVATLLMAVVLATAVEMSGTRVALGLLLAGMVVAARGIGLVRIAAMVVAVGLGVALGTVLQADRADTSALARFSAAPAEGLGGRVENWKGGLQGALDRPVLGHGPGQYARAAGPHRTLALAHAFGPDSFFQDAHNLAVEYAATTGLVGLALLVAWVAWSVAGARRSPQPELLVAAAVLFSFQLLEPQNVAVTPLGFLLLAAANRAPAPAVKPYGRLALASKTLAGLALVPAIALVGGDALMRLGALRSNEVTADRASALLRPWAMPLSIETRIHLFRYRTEGRPAELRAALDSARRGVDREPYHPPQHVELGDVYRRLGRHREAADAFARALEWNPWSVVALRSRARALDKMGEEPAAAACRRLATLATAPASSTGDIGRSRSACLG